MDIAAPISVNPASLIAPPAPSAAEMARRGQIAQTARDFEATFMSQMLNSMFAGVSTEQPFGGGEGEAMWKSFLNEAMAKQMTRAGGIGLSAAVEREMLKLQGLE